MAVKGYFIMMFLLCICINIADGKQYLIVFPPSYYYCDRDRFEILLSTPVTRAHVSLKTRYGTSTFSVRKDLGHRHDLNTNEFCIAEYNHKERKAVLVQSEDPIVVHGHVSDYKGEVPGAFLAVSVEENSREFIISSYTPYSGWYGFFPADIFVAALRDNTHIFFTFQNGTIESVTLSALGTYGLNSSQDLTGTRVIADAPISVFSGAVYAYVPSHVSGGDRLIENIPPLSCSGRIYILPHVINQKTGYIIRVLFSKGSGTLSMGGSRYNNPHGRDIVLENKAYLLNCSADCFVYQYNMGGGAGSGNSEPFMLRLLPVSQYVNRLLWMTPKLPQGRDTYNNYVTIIAPTKNKGGVRLNGQTLNARWSAVGSDFSALSQRVSDGTHVVDHPDINVKLAAYALAHGNNGHGSYAFSAGTTDPPRWEQWAYWGSCSVSCGGGIRIQRRECNYGSYAPTDCVGNNQENETCNAASCPPDPPRWEQWSCWGSCSVSCGVGIRTRNRECKSDSYAPRDCAGNNQENESCNAASCPPVGRIVIVLSTCCGALLVVLIITWMRCYRLNRRQLTKPTTFQSMAMSPESDAVVADEYEELQLNHSREVPEETVYQVLNQE